MAHSRLSNPEPDLHVGVIALFLLLVGGFSFWAWIEAVGYTPPPEPVSRFELLAPEWAVEELRKERTIFECQQQGYTLCVGDRAIVPTAVQRRCLLSAQFTCDYIADERR